MQDQYGLFLQAGKEERMGILGNILGLGVYAEMENTAAVKLSAENREIRLLTDKINGLTADLGDLDVINNNIAVAKANIAGYEAQIKEKTIEADAVKVSLNTQKEAKARADKLTAEIADIKAKRLAAIQGIDLKRRIIDNAEKILLQKEAVKAGIDEYNALIEKEKSILGLKATASEIARQGKKAAEAAEENKAKALKLRSEYQIILGNIAALKLYTGKETETTKKYNDYMKYLAESEETQKHLTEHGKLEKSLREAKTNLLIIETNAEAESDKLINRLAELNKKVLLLKNSGCPDSEKATCNFLKDAAEAKRQISGVESSLNRQKEQSSEKIEAAKKAIADAENNLAESEYNPSRVSELKRLCAELKAYEGEYIKLPELKKQLQSSEARLADITGELSEIEKNINKFKAEAEALRDKYKVSGYSEKAYVELQNQITEAGKWFEKEKELPVAEEKKKTALIRISEITGDIAGFQTACEVKRVELEKESAGAGNIETLMQKVYDIEGTIIRHTYAMSTG
jgi:exonuclease SbcC